MIACASMNASNWYLLPSGLGVLFFSFPHCSDEFDKDCLSVLHLLYILKPLVSAMLHSKFTKCGSKSIRQQAKSPVRYGNNQTEECTPNTYRKCFKRAPPPLPWCKLCLLHHPPELIFGLHQLVLLLLPFFLCPRLHVLIKHLIKTI